MIYASNRLRINNLSYEVKSDKWIVGSTRIANVYYCEIDHAKMIQFVWRKGGPMGAWKCSITIDPAYVGIDQKPNTDYFEWDSNRLANT